MLLLAYARSGNERERTNKRSVTAFSQPKEGKTLCSISANNRSAEIARLSRARSSVSFKFRPDTVNYIFWPWTTQHCHRNCAKNFRRKPCTFTNPATNCLAPSSVIDRLCVNVRLTVISMPRQFLKQVALREGPGAHGNLGCSKIALAV